jgi:hypothetical protein
VSSTVHALMEPHRRCPPHHAPSHNQAISLLLEGLAPLARHQKTSLQEMVATAAAATAAATQPLPQGPWGRRAGAAGAPGSAAASLRGSDDARDQRPAGADGAAEGDAAALERAAYVLAGAAALQLSGGERRRQQ